MDEKELYAELEETANKIVVVREKITAGKAEPQDLQEMNHAKTLLYLYYGVYDRPENIGEVIIEFFDLDKFRRKHLVLPNPNALPAIGPREKPPLRIKHTLVPRGIAASDGYLKMPISTSQPTDTELKDFPY